MHKRDTVIPAYPVMAKSRWERKKWLPGLTTNLFRHYLAFDGYSLVPACHSSISAFINWYAAQRPQREPRAETDSHLVIQDLFADNLDKFCDSRLRKFFHRFAERRHVLVDNRGRQGSYDFGEFMGHLVKKLRRYCFLRDVCFIECDVRAFKSRCDRLLFVVLQLASP